VPLGEAWTGALDFQGWLAQSEYARQATPR